ncbi:MAG: hypothetical protein ACRDKS_03470, partial [Actinomycetota bacterium]
MIDIDAVVADLRDRAQQELGGSLAETVGEDAEQRAWALLVEMVEEENRRHVLGGSASLSTDERTAIAKRLFDLFFRLGPLQRYLDDAQIEEIVVNAHDRGFVIRAGGGK